jgi:lipoyl(octanoyl) transferase
VPVNELHWHWLGRVEYADGLELQRRFAEARASDGAPDNLFLLEHSPVITLGRKATPGNILLSKAALAQQGVELFETDRGGDVTYHGPGQLVGYPILRLPEGRQDVRRYVRDIEEVVLRVLGSYGIDGEREPRWPGVWVRRPTGLEKVAAVGVHLSRWVTRHGFALNVSTNLSHFGLIVPCGIREAGVTSMERLLGRRVPLEEVAERIAQTFSEVFEASARRGPSPKRTVSVVVVERSLEASSEPRVLLLRRTAARGGFWQPVTGKLEAGETPSQAAGRELFEETGLEAPVVSLDYVHAFSLGPSPSLALGEESAFRVEAPAGFAPRLDSSEHDAFEWLQISAALERLPFAGLQAAVRRAASQLNP